MGKDAQAAREGGPAGAAGPAVRRRRRGCAPAWTLEVDDGIVIDVDADGHPVGIDIDQASKHLDLRTLELRRIPFGVEKVAG